MQDQPPKTALDSATTLGITEEIAKSRKKPRIQVKNICEYLVLKGIWFSSCPLLKCALYIIKLRPLPVKTADCD